jgi:Immunity protein 42
MKIFGDKNTFAISYKPDNQQVIGNYAFPYCHFILNNELVGYEDEGCFLSIWAGSLLYLKQHVEKKETCLREPEFKGLSDIEILELIEKANQFEEEYENEYLYLPKLKSEVWNKYRVDMDETIDGFSIILIEENDALKFIFRDNKHKSKINTAVTTHQHFYKTVDECLDFLIETYPNVIGNLKNA